MNCRNKAWLNYVRNSPNWQGKFGTQIQSLTYIQSMLYLQRNCFRLKLWRSIAAFLKGIEPEVFLFTRPDLHIDLSWPDYPSKKILVHFTALSLSGKRR